jgi:hypothetical protein
VVEVEMEVVGFPLPFHNEAAGGHGGHSAMHFLSSPTPEGLMIVIYPTGRYVHIS